MMPIKPLWVLVMLLLGSLACFATESLTAPQPDFPALEPQIMATVTATPIPSSTALPSPTTEPPTPTGPPPTLTQTSTPIATYTPSATLTPSATPTPFPTLTPTASPTPPGYSLNLWLAPARMDADLLAQTALILQERLTLAGIEGVVEQDGAELRIRTNASSDQLVRLMTHVGWVELVDFSDLNTAYIPSVGSCLLTTAQQTVYAEQDICAVSELTPLEHPNGGPFETLLAATDFAAVQLSEPLLGQSRWTLSGHVTPAAQPLLADLTEARQGQQLGLLLDGELLSAPTIAAPITDGRFLIELDAEWSAAQAQDLQVVLATAPLPLALTLTGSKAFPAGDADYQRPQ